MKKLMNKILAALIIFSLVGMSFISDAVYATEIVTNNVSDLVENNLSSSANISNAVNLTNLEKEANTDNVQTSGISVTESNNYSQSISEEGNEVELSATINNSYGASADIMQELRMHISIYVRRAGYLKNVSVDLSDGNYEISKTTEEINKEITDKNPNISKSKLIRELNGNVIQLNEIDAGDTLEFDIPIKYKKKELVSAEEYNKESQVVLKGIHVNSRNEEKAISVSKSVKIQWTVKGEASIKQELLRYLKYNGRTMISFKITDLIKENVVPVNKKEISIVVPKLNNELPTFISATGENVEQQYNNGILTIVKTNKPNAEGKYNFQTQDEYTVTYVYNNQTESAVLETSAKEKITTIANSEINADTEVNQYEVNAEVGSIVGLQVGIPQEINKGYMYTNLNRAENKLDTDYKEVYRINVGYAELTDKITITEDSTTLNDENKNILADINNEIKTTKVSVSREELTKVLGENGTIIVRNEQAQELGKLNKDTTELNVEANKVSFETTNPEKEGDLNINLNKKILGGVNFTKEGLQLIKELSSQVTTTGYSQNNEITKSTITGAIGLTDPTSKGSVDTNIDTLSTVSNNENVVFNITLNKTDISDALYTNPAIRITLPQQVKNIDVTSARVVYDDELNAGDIQVNGNEIVIYLRGTQTQYNTLATTQGTLVRVVTNLGLDYLLPSSTENVKVELYNEATGEMNSVEKQINIVAPNDFIRTHEMTIDGESRQAIDNDAETVKLKTGEQAKTMQVSGQVINNLGGVAEGFAILGRLPCEGNKTIGGQDLGSNINTTLASPIEVEGLENAVIMYSNNVQETLDSINWTTQPIQDAKSFKIESTTGVNDKQLVKFKYAVTIPENLEYEKTGKFNYGIYYNNNAQQGVSRNIVESKNLSFETGLPPALRIGVSATDTNEGYAINEGGDVREGQYITYRIKVANTGSQDANDVAIGAAMPEGVTLIMPDYDSSAKSTTYRESSSKFLFQEIGTIAGGASDEYEFTAKISDNLAEEQKAEGKDIQVAFSLTGDILGEDPISTVYTVKNKPGYFSVKLNSDAIIVEPNDEINYTLDIKNANNDNKTNMNAKINLPEGVKYTGIDDKYKDSVNYDEKNNVVNIKLETLDKTDKKVNIKAKNEHRSNGELKATASVSCDGLNGEIKSNEVEAYTQDPKAVLKVTQTTNAGNNLSDTDDIMFYTDITNEGLYNKTVTFKDELISNIAVDETVVTLDGNSGNIGKTNYINSPITIPAGKTVRIITKAKSYPIEEGKALQVENKPTVIADNGDEIDVNSVSLGVRGTAPKQSNEKVDEGIRENSIIKSEDQTYKITGTLWLDQNKNGKKDIGENGFKGVNLQLYDNKRKEIAKDNNNNNLIVTSEENGSYLFENLKPGNYVVVAEYDNNQYEIANYKADGVSDSENSDFVTAKLDSKEVGATENLEIKFANYYNMDLGLINKEQFNLNVDQSVTRVTISSEKEGTRVIGFDNKEAELRLSDEELKNSTMLVEYNIKVTNSGTVPGYAKQVMNYIPKGMTFNSEINPDWYMGKDGNLYTVNIENDNIKPGESKDIKLLLAKHIQNEETGIYRGRTQIEKTYNEKGLKSINAASGNYSNLSATDVVILKQSKIRIIAVIGMSIGLVALIGLAVYEIKKHFIDKMYNYEDLNFLNKD